MRQLIHDTLIESAEAKRRAAEHITNDIAQAAELLLQALRAGGKVVVFGNGGSAADAQHFAAELVGRFSKERKAMPALALTVNSSTLTSVSNDYGFDSVFLRQVEAFVEPKDVAVGISTSGTSASVLKALERAKGLGAATIGLTGREGGDMPQYCNVCVTVPHKNTARIQEVHITIIHAWCEIIDSILFHDK